MAEITQGGATEAARIKTSSPGRNVFIWVMCSDGRILRKMEMDEGPFRIYRRGWKGARTQETLIEMARACGHEVVSDNG